MIHLRYLKRQCFSSQYHNILELSFCLIGYWSDNHSCCQMCSAPLISTQLCWGAKTWVNSLSCRTGVYRSLVCRQLKTTNYFSWDSFILKNGRGNSLCCYKGKTKLKQKWLTKAIKKCIFLLFFFFFFKETRIKPGPWKPILHTVFWVERYQSAFPNKATNGQDHCNRQQRKG